MAKTRALAPRFDAVNKGALRIPQNHSRTGACSSKGKCFHRAK